MIPVMRPQLPTAEQVRPWLERMDASRTYSNYGPLVRELEAAHAQRVNIDPEHVVSVANATLGLIGALQQSLATTWHVPAFTFPASAHAVLAANKQLVLDDIHADSWLLDTTDTPTIHGIMPVLPFGASIDLNAWQEFDNVVIDAAASLGAENIDLSQLPQSWTVVFSLHATKVLPAGEGGLVVFGDKEKAKQFRAWCNFGFAGTRFSQIPATNAKMSEFTAAYGLASLSLWDQEANEWQAAHETAQAITTRLSLQSPVQLVANIHPYWIVQTPTSEECDLLERKLQTAEIESRRWWPAPLQDMPAFAGTNAKTPNADHAAKTSLGLPMFRGITDDQFEAIEKALAAPS